MTLPLEALQSEVLRLPAADRRRLLDRVIASLDEDAARHAAWDQLAAQREAAAAADPSLYSTLNEALAQVRTELT